MTNQSSITFRSQILPPGLSYHLFDEADNVVLWDGPRVSFSPPLRPGKDQILTLPIAAPAKLGRSPPNSSLTWSSKP